MGVPCPKHVGEENQPKVRSRPGFWILPGAERSPGQSTRGLTGHFAVLPGCRQVADCCWGGRTQNKNCQLGPCTEMMPGVNAAGGGDGLSSSPPFNLNP
ncbi:unnamed protein product [Gulo gulo]|uniref:Uncharacterized protein n=1 Tax=Gulo gulo TaxID=48420 RepID=A0A9X9Q6U9_GULGU|nr:unnamed protein product [Gulo gulo]